MKKITLTLLSVVFIVVLVLIFSPPSNSVSNNPCNGAGCHGSRNYYQYLDILEGDNSNQIPFSLSLNETKTVTIVIQNDVDAPIYTALTSVSATLRSAYSHFAISNPTYNIGDLAPGKITATWQITALTEGYDYLIIQSSAYNPHKSCYFSDTYSPYPSITVGQPTGTPEPPPNPTPAPTNPPATATPSTSTPTPAATSTPTNHPTAQPSSSPSINQTQLSIQLISPSQNEKLIPNTKYDIEWAANGGTIPLNVSLDYSSEDDHAGWINIATNLPGSGRYSWTTPNATSYYYIRVSVQDSSSPSQTTSTMETVEIEKANNSELPIIPIIIVVLVVIVLIIAVLMLTKRRNKNK